jgi:RNA polymerase sigma factor for flagellar operon FliA
MTHAAEETRGSRKTSADSATAKPGPTRMTIGKSAKSDVPLSALDNDPRIKIVWQTYKTAPTPEFRNELMEHYLPLVNKCAQRLHQKLPAVVQIDDLVSAGVLGLMDAIEAFEPGRAIKFATFSALRIRGAILDELRSMDWAPRQARNWARKMENASRELQADLGRQPTDAEMAQHLKITDNEYEHVARTSRSVTFTSLSRRREGNSEGDEMEPYLSVPDERALDPMQESQRRFLKGYVTRGLSRAERLLVTLYYYENLTMREVGQVLDLSESRVSQLHSQIISRLRDAANTTGKALQELEEAA